MRTGAEGGIEAGGRAGPPAGHTTTGPDGRHGEHQPLPRTGGEILGTALRAGETATAAGVNPGAGT